MREKKKKPLWNENSSFIWNNDITKCFFFQYNSWYFIMSIVCYMYIKYCEYEHWKGHNLFFYITYTPIPKFTGKKNMVGYVFILLKA